MMGFLDFHKMGLETHEWHEFSGVGFFLTPVRVAISRPTMQHSSQVPNVLTTDAWDLSKGEMECRRQNKIALKFFRK